MPKNQRIVGDLFLTCLGHRSQSTHTQDKQNLAKKRRVILMLVTVVVIFRDVIEVEFLDYNWLLSATLNLQFHKIKI